MADVAATIPGTVLLLQEFEAEGFSTCCNSSQRECAALFQTMDSLALVVLWSLRHARRRHRLKFRPTQKTDSRYCLA